jgi:hypothetical protein
MTKIDLEREIEKMKRSDAAPAAEVGDQELLNDAALLHDYIRESTQKLAVSGLQLDVYRIAAAVSARLKDTPFEHRTMIFPTDTLEWLKSDGLDEILVPYGIGIEVIDAKTGKPPVYAVKIRYVRPYRQNMR